MTKYVQVKIKLCTKLAVRNGNRLNYTLNLPREATMGHVMIKIRRMTKGIKPEEALFIFVGDSMPAMSKILGSYGKKSINCDLHLEGVFG